MPALLPYTATYATTGGSRGTLTVLAPTSCDAVLQVMDALPGLCRLTMKPGPRPAPQGPDLRLVRSASGTPQPGAGAPR